MKTLKATTLITGIIVALFSLTAHASEKPEMAGPNKTTAYKLEMLGIDQSLENEIIEDYLQSQTNTIDDNKTKNIVIYDDQANEIFSGKADTDEAVILSHTADFLMEYDHTAYFIK